MTTREFEVQDEAEVVVRRLLAQLKVVHPLKRVSWLSENARANEVVLFGSEPLGGGRVRVQACSRQGGFGDVWDVQVTPKRAGCCSVRVTSRLSAWVVGPGLGAVAAAGVCGAIALGWWSNSSLASAVAYLAILALWFVRAYRRTARERRHAESVLDTALGRPTSQNR
jgi:hypothetical protein